MSERDDGRVSMIHERAAPAEGRFLAMLRALADVQSHGADARSVAYGQRSSGGLREVTATERAIDAGAVGRGRRAWARLAATTGDARRALEWLTTYARSGDLASLGALYAEHAGPADLRAGRDAAAAAHARATEAAALATTAVDGARRVLGASKAPEAVAAHLAAKAAATTARDRLGGARVTAERTAGELRAWGVAAMGAALRAWERTSESEAA